jgi:hypothetical protein
LRDSGNTERKTLMRLAAPLLALLLCAPTGARSDPANAAVVRAGTAGPAARLILAQDVYQTAMATGDAVMLLAAIRLARGVTLRPPTGWTLTTTGEATDAQPDIRAAPPDPASAQVIAIVQALAGEDPSLQDLVYDLDAQLPHHRTATAIAAISDLDPDRTDSWRMAFSGQVAVELGLIGDGDAPLSFTVTDEAGDIVCARAPALEPGLCRFTPARNGFFTVTIQNLGATRNSYRLIGN